MIVVALVGILAALALYGVRAFLAHARSSEAKNMVGAICRSAVTAYEREIARSEYVAPGGESSQASRALCGTAPPVPAVVPVNVKYTPNGVEGFDFETGSDSAGWRCLRFTITDPIYYQYGYNDGATTLATGNPASIAGFGSSGFEAIAVGDQDGDGIPSYFARTGRIESTGQLNLATMLYEEGAFE